MHKVLAFLCCSLAIWQCNAAEVLIVADEFPAMKVLANKLKTAENINSRLIWQTNLPADLAPFAAVIVYIHKDLNEAAERAFIKYTQDGGRLLALHHSISSGKRKNKQWFKFLGVELPERDLSQGGYKWIEGVTLGIVDLAPQHFITTHKVKYPVQVAWEPAGAKQETLPGFSLPNSEVYLNHVLTEPRTLLLGFRYADEKSGRIYCQSHAGWIRRSGKGWIIYLMPGHSALDFENPAYAQIVLNAVVWKP